MAKANATNAGNTGVQYFDGTSAFAGVTGSTGQILRATTGAAPTYSTSTYPSTNAINTILYASASNVMSALATANSAILNTSSGGVPSLATSPSVSGTITAGTGFTATTGNVTITSGNLLLPTTTSTIGQIKINNVAYFHNGGNSHDIFIAGAGNFTSSGNENIGIGSQAQEALTSGSFNVGIGSISQQKITTPNDNVAVGYQTQNTLTTGTANIAMGRSAQFGITTGSFNIGIGYANHFGAITGTDNIALGQNTQNGAISGFSNIGIGRVSQEHLTSGDHNIAMGYQSQNTLTTGIRNISIGAVSQFSLTTGGYNIAIGYLAQAGTGTPTGDDNIGIGQNAQQNITGATTANVAIGRDSQKSATGNNNTTFGFKTGANFTTGAGNVLIGANAGQNYTGAESNNVLIGLNESGTNGESNVTKINTANGTTCYVGGIYGITTASGTTSTVLISNGNQLGTISSSRRFKRDIKDMEQESSSIMSLRPVTFQYKSHTDNVTQFGLIAEEVMEIMPEIVNLDGEGKPESIRYHDLPCMLLNEIQKLQKRIEKLENNLSI